MHAEAPTKLHNVQPATLAVYGSIQDAFDHFNRDLFNSRLPDVVVTFQRKKQNHGIYIPGVWNSSEGKESRDEISLNPDTLERRSIREVLSTLVHEMTHCEQQHFGTPSRNGYHNAEWGGLMDRVGLTPSNTGEPDGKRTGQQMTHYIVEGGPFAVSFDTLMATGWRLDWKARDTEKPSVRKAKKESKTAYVCPCCATKAWGKPGLSIGCMDCRVQMTPA